MPLSSSTLTALQKAGAAAFIAGEKLQEEVNACADRVNAAITENAYSSGNDTLIENWKVNYDTFSVLIVLNIGRQVVGMVVDGVSDVISLTPEQLRPVSEFSLIIGSDHLLAIGSVQDRMLMLLDIENLLTSAEMRLLAAISAISPSGINKANDAKENAGQLFQGVL